MASPTVVRRRFGKALAFSLPALGILGLSTVVVTTSMTARDLSAASPEQSLADVAPKSLVYGGELAHLGLTSEAFAAAGVTGQTVRNALNFLAADSGQGIARYQSARTRHAKAEAAYRRMATRVRSGRDEMGDVADVAPLRAHAQQCLAECQTAAQGIMTLLGAALTPEQSAALRSIRSNQEQGVPLPYAATELTEAERLRLRSALVLQRVVDEDGGELDPEVRAFLDSLESRPEVIAASNGMAGLSEVAFAYRTALESLDAE